MKLRLHHCLLAAAALLMPGAKAAQYGNWTSTRIGGGGYLLNTVFCASNPEVVYCNSDVGGLFKSEDGGKTWRMIHGNAPSPLYFVRGIDVDPRNADIVLAAVGEQWGPRLGVYRTADGGKSWNLVCPSAHYGNSAYRQSGNVLARNPSAPDTVYMASSDGVFVSRDNGVSWKKLGLAGYGISALVIDRANPARLWLCAQTLKVRDHATKEDRQLKSGLFVTENGGADWTCLADEAPIEMVQAPWNPALLYGIFQNSRPAVSADGGKSWTTLTDGLESLSPDKKPSSSSDSYYSALGTGPDFLVLGSGCGSFYRLDRDSRKWRKLATKWDQEDWFLADHPGGWQHFGRATSSVTVDPVNPNRWLFTDWYAVYSTNDGGKNWKLSFDGIEMTVIHHLVADPAVPGRVYLGMADNTILISEDGGKTFHSSKNGKGNTKCIAAAANRPGMLYAVGPREWDWKANALFVSSDSGENWKHLPAKGLAGLDKNEICSVVVSPVQSDEVSVARGGAVSPGEGGVWRSTDGGKTFGWFSQGMEGEKNFFRNSIWHSGVELAVSGDGKHLAAISQSSRNLYYREEGDSAWRKSAAVPGTHYEIVGDPRSKKRFYLASKGAGLFRSDDGGKTWKQVFQGDASAVACDPKRDGRLAIALLKEGKVLVSEDAGNSWKELDASLPNRKGLKLCFSGDRLIAGTDGNGVFYLDLKPQSGTEAR